MMEIALRIVLLMVQFVVIFVVGRMAYATRKERKRLERELRIRDSWHV